MAAAAVQAADVTFHDIEPTDPTDPAFLEVFNSVDADGDGFVDGDELWDARESLGLESVDNWHQLLYHYQMDEHHDKIGPAEAALLVDDARHEWGLFDTEEEEEDVCCSASSGRDLTKYLAILLMERGAQYSLRLLVF